MEEFARLLLDFVAAHQGWAVAVMFVTAFGESFAFLSLIFPGTTLLIAAGGLLKSGVLPVLPVLIGAVVGATLGDSVSYWLGRRFGSGLTKVWPFTRNPQLIPVGIRFFERHGGKSVFIGRFFGPVRAVIPLAAGIMRMPRGRFWFANITSAVVWAPMLLFVGDVIDTVGEHFLGQTNAAVVVFVGLTMLGVVGVVWAALRAVRSKP